SNPVWSADGKGLFIQYDDSGETKLGFLTLDGRVRPLTTGLGGNSLDRPYPGASFSVSRAGRYAATTTSPDHPSDVMVGGGGGPDRRLTNLPAGLFAGKQLGAVETIHYQSSYDHRG